MVHKELSIIVSKSDMNEEKVYILFLVDCENGFTSTTEQVVSTIAYLPSATLSINQSNLACTVAVRALANVSSTATAYTDYSSPVSFTTRK